MAARLERVVDELDDTIKDIRRTIFSLGALESSDDLQSEMTRVVERSGTAMKLRPTLRFDGPVRSITDPELIADLLAVLSEALTNVTRHASASAVSVLLSVTKDVVLTVSDDGVGLPGSVSESGLANMRQRALRHGGSLEVSQPADGGTVVRWQVSSHPA